MSPIVEVVLLTIVFTGLIFLFGMKHISDIPQALLYHGIAFAIALLISQIIYHYVIKI